MRLQATSSEYDQFLDAAQTYWATNTPAAGSAWILVEALHQDIRVTLRNLTIANALRRLVPARVLVVTGTDPDWFSALFTRFEVADVRRLAAAFGAETLDVHELVDRTVASAAAAGNPPPVVVGGRPLGPSTVPGIDPDVLAQVVESTMCRVKKVPRLPQDVERDPEYQRLSRRSAAFSAVYDRLVAGLRPIALVTSHVDYNQWGLAVESAMRLRVPVVHAQTTGSLKAYALFPERAEGLPTFRAELTRQVGSVFESQIWPRRDLLRRSAELVAWRAKANLGRPSWWRAGAGTSLDLTTPAERSQLRGYVLRRLGFDPTLPVVVVFNHAVSDARRTNHEAFADLATWFEETVAFAASYPRANWLFLDHPSQALYDATGFFASLSDAHTALPHLAFRQSRQLSKNLLWSVADLGVTVRGSVSNELPAYGIPVLQAGWSEWSDCGLSTVAEDPESYFTALKSGIEALFRGEPLIRAEHVERARLWLWLYRSGADVVSSLVPAWDEGESNPMLRSLRLYMRHVESDGDPVFLAVERMWTRREPFLTRVDLTSEDALRAALPRRPGPEQVHG